MMMLNKDPKKIASMIVMKVGKPEGESSESESKPDDGIMSAAEEAMAAIEKKDVKAFAEAMKAMVSMCGGHDEKSYGEVEE